MPQFYFESFSIGQEDVKPDDGCQQVRGTKNPEEETRPFAKNPSSVFLSATPCSSNDILGLDLQKNVVV